MAVSQIEEKILGRLAKQTAPKNALLSASFYQILGLSILLSRKLYRARKQRKLDITRDTKSLQLYHHIIWLAREGLSITEVYILPYCQDGEQGPECRVMAAKLRASLYHVFCLFHNHPPVSQLSARSFDSGSPHSSSQTPKGSNEPARNSPRRSPKQGKESAESRRRTGKAPLRDPIPSMTSETSYVTNPYAAGMSQTPPIQNLSGYPEARKTPTRPPGLAPINISASQAAASFLLPPLNFVPMTKEHFDTAQHLANSLLSPTHALRLAVSLEHAAFLWDCTKQSEAARRLSRRAIRDVYASSDGLDDDEFADASALVQALGGIVRRGSAESTPRPRSDSNTSSAPGQQQPQQQPQQQQQQQHTRTVPAPPTTRSGLPIIDRTIAVSPASGRRGASSSSSPAQPQFQAPLSRTHLVRTPERLSTVPEVDSVIDSQGTTAHISPPVSRLSSQRQPSRRNTVSSVASSSSSPAAAAAGAAAITTTASSSDRNKSAKRRAVERAEADALQRQRTRSSASNASSTQRSSGSRQQTPPYGHPSSRTIEWSGVTSYTASPMTSHEFRAKKPPAGDTPALLQHERSPTDDRNDAVLDALQILGLSSRPAK